MSNPAIAAVATDAHATASKAWEALRRNVAMLSDAENDETREAARTILRDLATAQRAESAHMLAAGMVAHAESTDTVAGELVAIGYRAAACFMVSESRFAQRLLAELRNADLDRKERDGNAPPACRDCTGAGRIASDVCGSCHGSGYARHA